jgi:outer membrane protein TolC
VLDTSSAQGGTTYGAGAGVNGAAPAPPTNASTWDQISGWFNSLDKATQGRIVSGLMQGGGQAVGGLFNAWTSQQKLALQQQAQNLINQQYNTSVANANSIPTVGAAYSSTQPAGSGAAPVTMAKPTPVINNGASGLANATPVQQGMLTS